MRKTLFTFFAGFLGLTSVANAAEINMRPGLWEITTASDLLWLAGQIPPDQMKNIQDMATEYGLELPQVNNGAAKSNACITQEWPIKIRFLIFINQLAAVRKT